MCTHACTRHVSVHSQPKHTCGGRGQLCGLRGFQRLSSGSQARVAGALSPSHCTVAHQPKLHISRFENHGHFGIICGFPVSFFPRSCQSRVSSPPKYLCSHFPAVSIASFFTHDLCSSPQLSQSRLHTGALSLVSVPTVSLVHTTGKPLRCPPYRNPSTT